MGEWTRTTKWRQGSLLPAKSALALGLARDQAEADKFVFMAISHDCDIANTNTDAEPDVEFAIGKRIPAVDGSYTRAKNPRTLHLAFRRPEGSDAVAFFIRDRVLVEKAALADHEPDTDCVHASPQGVGSLRWWLAARYFRSSFPDSFERRLSQSKLDERIDKLLSPHGDAVYGIFFLVDDGQGSSHADDEIHELRAFVVYDSASDERLKTAIETATKSIAAEFTKRFFDPQLKTWKHVELLNCDSVSDFNFTYGHSRVYKQWKLEHRSLADKPQKLPFDSV